MPDRFDGDVLFDTIKAALMAYRGKLTLVDLRLVRRLVEHEEDLQLSRLLGNRARPGDVPRPDADIGARG